MTVEHKLEVFTQMIAAETAEKQRQMTRDLAQAFKTAVDEAVNEAEKASRERIRAERYQIEKDKNKRVAAASAEAKRALIALRDRLTAALFDEVADDLRLFAASPSYAAWLPERVRMESAKAAGRYAYVLLMERDMGLAEEIAAVCGLTAEPVAEDWIGGFKLTTKNRRAIADFTFSTRIKDEMRDFSMRIGQSTDRKQAAEKYSGGGSF